MERLTYRFFLIHFFSIDFYLFFTKAHCYFVPTIEFFYNDPTNQYRKMRKNLLNQPSRNETDKIHRSGSK